MLDLLRPMAAFARTVEAGSFRAAARDLGLSPSVVGHHVAQLEARLGVALIYRSTRRLSLTHDGEKLFVEARRMVEAAAAGLDLIAGRVAQPGGELTVTAPSVLVDGFLIEDLAAFARAYPRVRLDLSFSDMRRDLIGEGIDLAIRMGWLADSALKSRKLREMTLAVIATPGYLAGKPVPAHPADLARLDWIRLRALPPRASLTNAGGEVTEFGFEERVTADDATAIYRLAREGLGLGMVPRSLAAADLAAGILVEVLPGWRLDAPGVFAVWPPNAARRSLTMLLVEFLDKRARAARSGPACGAAPPRSGSTT